MCKHALLSWRIVNHQPKSDGHQRAIEFCWNSLAPGRLSFNYNLDTFNGRWTYTAICFTGQRPIEAHTSPYHNWWRNVLAKLQFDAIRVYLSRKSIGVPPWKDQSMSCLWLPTINLGMPKELYRSSSAHLRGNTLWNAYIHGLSSEAWYSELTSL